MVETDYQDKWPCGLRVMVVDSNPLYLLVLEQLLCQCNYSVTTRRDASEAMSCVMGGQQFDLVVSDVFLPSEDGLRILKTFTLQLGILVIMMSWSEEKSLVMKCISNGACDFLIKPLRINELKNIWQHVFRRDMKKHMDSEWRLDSNMAANTTTPTPTSLSVPQRRIISSGHPIICSSAACNDVQESFNHQVIEDARELKMSRLHWTRQLHQQFVVAVNVLGVDEAVPKKILEMMNVRNLTREQVASHLQKYRLHLKRSCSFAHEIGMESSSSHEGSLKQLGSLEENMCLTYRGRSSRSSNFIEEDGNAFISELVPEFGKASLPQETTYSDLPCFHDSP